MKWLWQFDKTLFHCLEGEHRKCPTWTILQFASLVRSSISHFLSQSVHWSASLEGPTSPINFNPTSAWPLVPMCYIQFRNNQSWGLREVPGQMDVIDNPCIIYKIINSINQVVSKSHSPSLACYTQWIAFSVTLSSPNSSYRLMDGLFPVINLPPYNSSLRVNSLQTTWLLDESQTNLTSKSCTLVRVSVPLLTLKGLGQTHWYNTIQSLTLATFNCY